MTRLMLHVGLPKTGTTAFQWFAAANRSGLAARGVAYCDGFRMRNHVELAVAFSHRITPLTRRYGVHDEADRRVLRERLPNMLGDPHRATTVLASSEHLTNLVYRPESVQEAASTLRALFDSVVVVLVLRRSDFWTPSMYTESVKAGGVRPLDAHFVDRHRRFLDHAALLERWRAGFGRENVIPLPFLERDKADPTAVPLALLAVAGVDVRSVDTWATSPRPWNRSISAYAVELMRRMNAEHPDSPLRDGSLRKRTVRTAHRQWPGAPQTITPAASDRLAYHGWVRTDVGAIDSAPGWQEWLAQPEAATMTVPEVADEDVQRLVKMIREPAPDPTRLSRTPARARRLARKLIRTIAPS